MNVPQNLKYTSTHEWISLNGTEATVGITDHAQSELGDIVFVELPQVGQKVEVGSGMGTIEAVKTVADLYAPLAGTITEVNSALQEDAAIINKDPYNQGWIAKISFEGKVEGLLDAQAYEALLH